MSFSFSRAQLVLFSPSEGPAAVLYTMTKEEDVQMQGRHGRDQHEDGTVQREEEEDALTDKEEDEEDDMDEDTDQDERQEQSDAEQDEPEPEESPGHRQEQGDKPADQSESKVEPECVPEYKSPVHDTRRRAKVHSSALAPLPKDYGTSFRSTSSHIILYIPLDLDNTSQYCIIHNRKSA